MEHTIREEGGVIIAALTGDVDLESSPKAREVLLECVAKKTTVLADLSGVNYIDSSGIASLVEAFQKAKSGGGGFALAAVSETAMRVLELARLDKVFKIYPTVDDGIQNES